MVILLFANCTKQDTVINGDCIILEKGSRLNNRYAFHLQHIDTKKEKWYWVCKSDYEYYDINDKYHTDNGFWNY